MSYPLNGAQILVTRPAEQAEPLCCLIERAGGTAIPLPCLAISAVMPGEQAIHQAMHSDYWIFTSRNAVKFAQQAFGGKMPKPMQQIIAAVGQATANSLQQAGLNVDCVPQTGFSSEDLLTHPMLQASQLKGKHCTLIRGVGGRELLAEQLQQRGANIAYLEVYQRCLPEVDCNTALNALGQRRLAAVTVTSVETLQNLLLLIDSAQHPALKQLPLIVVSERIAQIARNLGFTKIMITQLPADTAILQALITCIDGDNSGRAH